VAAEASSVRKAGGYKRLHFRQTAANFRHKERVCAHNFYSASKFFSKCVFLEKKLGQKNYLTCIKFRECGQLLNYCSFAGTTPLGGETE